MYPLFDTFVFFFFIYANNFSICTHICLQTMINAYEVLSESYMFYIWQ